MSAEANNFGLSQIGQISVNVGDLERAIAFYRDTLGMRFLFSAPPQMAFFDCGGIRLLLGAADEDRDPSGSIVYYRVDDIQSAHRVLASRGVDFDSDPHLAHKAADYELWLAFFRDPDGNLLALQSEVKP